MASRKAFWIGVATMVLLALPLTAQAQPPYITTDTNTTLVSFNDGEAGALIAGSGAVVADSLTVINLSPNAAPAIKTVYGHLRGL